MKCNICSSEETKVISISEKGVSSDSFFIDEKLLNLICKTCGNVFNSTSREKLIEFYKNSYNLKTSSFNSETKYFSQNQAFSLSDWRLNELANNFTFSKSGNILDIGCGKGNFLFQFSKKNPKWNLFGTETSKNSLKFVKEKIPQILLKEGAFEANLFDEKFDIIVSLNVLEHVDNPNSFIQNVKLILKDEGIFMFDVPNFKLNPADFYVYDHLTHFTSETLENVLKINGLKIIKKIETSENVPLLIICKKSEQKTSFVNNYNLMQKLVDAHLKFNREIFEIYKKIDTECEKFGIIGLGIMVWVGIQNGMINKNKIESFFDENEFLIGETKYGIKIQSLNEISNHSNLSLIFSLSPCYIENILTKLGDNASRCLFPKEFRYYKKFF